MKQVILFFLIALTFTFSYFVFVNSRKSQSTTSRSATETQVFNPFPYNLPKIPPKQSYLTYLVGDSMVASLGPNANGLRLKLISYYPDNEFVNYNYGFGATNILTLNERLTNETSYEGVTFPPILKQGFDLIIIESFAYNPLSEYPLEDGLNIYETELDAAVKKIIETKPGAVLAFMTPIAPNKENFAKNSRDLSDQVRLQWVSEREAYVNKFVEYASSRQIPVINVYEKSLDSNGNGDLKYIDPHDFIHPSREGIELIENAIADFIFQNSIFP
jgi:hypothetical protein